MGLTLSKTSLACIEYIENLIDHVKLTYRDPYIVLGGDLNQWAAQEAVEEYPDMTEVRVGPTRGEREIDRLFCNMSRLSLIHI